MKKDFDPDAGDRHPFLVQNHSGLSRWSVALIVVFGATLLGIGLGGNTRVLTTHEVCFAQPAREMLASGDWVVPRLAGLPITEKPPLTYWAVAAAMSLFGRDDEWVVRSYGVPAAIFTALMIAALAARWFGNRVALAAGLMQLSVFYILQVARVAESDTLLLTAVCAAMCSFAWAAVDSPHGRRDRRWLPWAFYLAAGIAFLAKGLIGPVFIFSGCLLFVMWQRDWRRLWFFASPVGLTLFVTCLVAWPLAAWQSHPQFLTDQVHHHLGRFRGDMAANTGGTKPFLFYGYSILLVMLPWTPLAIWAAVRAVRGSFYAGVACPRLRGHDWFSGPEYRPFWRFTACWLLPGLAVLTASAWKHQHYSAPLLPPLSVLAAVGLFEYFAARQASGSRRTSWLAAGAVAACAAAVVAVQWLQPRGAAPITALVMFLGAAVLAMIYFEHRGWQRAQMASIFGTAWLAAVGALVFVMPHHDSYRDQAVFADQANSIVPAGKPLYLVHLPEFQITYYLKPPLVRIENERELIAGSTDLDDGSYILAPQYVVEALSKAGRVEVLDRCPTIRRIMTERDRFILARLTMPSAQATRPADGRR